MSAITTEGNTSVPASVSASYDPKTAIETEKYRWNSPSPSVPPIPPIPEEAAESWRRRATKRCSYTSAISVKGVTVVEQPLWAASRPTSVASTLAGWTSTTAARGDDQKRLQAIWASDPDNPRNWREVKKWYHAFAATFPSFVVGFTATVVVPAQRLILEAFDASHVEVVMPLAVYLLGLGIGVLLCTCSLTTLQRKLLMLTSLLLLAGFSIGAAFVHSLSVMIVLRFLAGFSASPALHTGSLVLTELWATKHRIPATITYDTVSILGPVVGFVVGGPIVAARGWRWTQYTATCLVVASICALLPTIGSGSNKMLSNRKSADGSVVGFAKKAAKAFATTLRTMMTTPSVLLVNLYVAFCVASLFAIVAVFPQAFGLILRSHLASQGVLLCGAVVGLALGYALSLFHNRFIYEPRAAQWKAEREAESEMVMAEKRATHRKSTASFAASRRATRMSSASNMQDMRRGSRTSVALSLKRLTSRPSELDLGEMEATKTKNTHISVACANYLNNEPENGGRRIMPERVLLVLNKGPAFGELCEALESYDLKFDRVKLAKVLTDAVSRMPTSPPPVDDDDAPPTPLARSKSMQQLAALAALESSIPPPMPAAQRPLAPPGMRYYNASENKARGPPPQWRLWLSLPASIFLPASLFMLGWGVSAEDVNSAIPAVALGLFGFGLVLILTSAVQYTTECYRSQERGHAAAGALVIRCLASFAFVMFAHPLYAAVGVSWAMSVLAFVTLAFGVVPWVVYFMGSKKKGSKR